MNDSEELRPFPTPGQLETFASTILTEGIDLPFLGTVYNQLQRSKTEWAHFAQTAENLWKELSSSRLEVRDFFLTYYIFGQHDAYVSLIALVDFRSKHQSEDRCFHAKLLYHLESILKHWDSTHYAEASLRDYLSRIVRRISDVYNENNPNKSFYYFNFLSKFTEYEDYNSK